MLGFVVLAKFVLGQDYDFESSAHWDSAGQFRNAHLFGQFEQHGFLNLAVVLQGAQSVLSLAVPGKRIGEELFGGVSYALVLGGPGDEVEL